MKDTRPVTALPPASSGAPANPMRWWRAYVIAFLAIWLVIAFGFHYWPEIRQHWPMSVVMVLGSLVAGSTPMGGGTVAFPILVLVFHQLPANARNFGLLIQALGMTSALLFILGRRVPVPVRMLTGSAAGAAMGFLLGTFVISPHVQSNLVKLLFSCLWMSFGLLTLFRNREICGLKGRGPANDTHTLRAGLVAGLIGGTLASMIGVGVEMCVYSVMVLVFRTDLKIAIPTAVAAAALASIEGAALHLWLGDVDRQAVMNWLAAAPIVIFGAPAGTWIVSVLPRIRVLYFVSGLCLFQFIWTLQQAAHGRAEWLFVVAAMTLAVVILVALYKAGTRRVPLETEIPVALGR